MEDILSTVNNELQPNTTITKQIKKKKAGPEKATGITRSS
jgi:hypothetical protein